MKKYTSIILAAIMVMTMAGCSSSSGVNGGFGAAPETVMNSGSDMDTAADGTYGGSAGAGEHSSMAGAVSDSKTGTVTGGTAGTSASGSRDSSSSSAAAADTTADGDKAATEAEATKSAASVDSAPFGVESTDADMPVLNTTEKNDVMDGDFVAEEPSAADDVAFDSDYEYADEYGEVDGFMEELAAPVDGCYPEVLPEEDCVIAEPDIPPQAGLLTGGEWKDNDHYNDWISLYQTHAEWNSYRDLWQSDYDIRHEVIVTANGEPVEGAEVRIIYPDTKGIDTAVTDNKGKAYLFIEKTDEIGGIDVTYGELSVTLDDVSLSESKTHNIDFETAVEEAAPALDLMLMIDTTGSMWDELMYIQAELEDVISRVSKDNPNLPIRVSVNFYRDEYDDYVIREFDFTENISQVISDIAAQEAAGGGDFPEAVHTALNSAVKNHNWNDNSTKLMFFVMDAPPHSDKQIIDEVNARVEDAAEMGIRIIPVASSGIDKSTEYLLRTMAFATGGTYTFLTDDSGIGGGHIEPTIGDYQVEKLNDMMVRIINDYLK